VSSLYVTVIHQSSATYPLEAFQEDIPSKDEVDYVIEPELLPDDFLKDLPASLRRRIIETPTGDRSKNDYTVSLQLLTRGFSPGQVLSVLLNPDWPVAAKTLEKGVGYAARTIGAAIKARTEAGSVDIMAQKTLPQLINELHWLENDKGQMRRVREIDPVSDFTEPCLQWLKSNGMSFLRDANTDDGYIFYNGRVVNADKDGRPLKDLLYELAHLTESDWDSRKLREAISHEARVFGKQTLLYQWVATDIHSCVMYVLPNPHGGSVVRVGKGEKLEMVANGTDGYLLKPSSLGSSIQVDFDVDKVDGLNRLIGQITPFFATTKAGQQVLTCYMLALALQRFASDDLLPILHVTGPSGGAKSWALKFITAWLYGHTTLLQATQASSYVLSDSDIFLPLDDYESLDAEWQRRLLTGATGQTRTKMAGDNTRAVFQRGTVSFAITSITPLPSETLRRRALVVEVNAKTFGHERFNPTTAIANLQRDRSFTWSAFLKLLHEDILPEMREGSAAQNIQEMQKLIQVEQNRSLSTFLSLMWLVGKSIDKYVPGFLTGDLAETLSSWLDVMHLQSFEEYQERDHLIFCISTLYDELSRGVGEMGRSNGIDVQPVVDERGRVIGFKGTGSQLHSAFATVCGIRRLRYEMTSPNSVGRRFQTSSELLRRSGWIAQPLKFGPNRGWEVIQSRE
jgi:hypothetical protein